MVLPLTGVVVTGAKCMRAEARLECITCANRPYFNPCVADFTFLKQLCRHLQTFSGQRHRAEVRVQVASRLLKLWSTGTKT